MALMPLRFLAPGHAFLLPHVEASGVMQSCYRISAYAELSRVCVKSFAQCFVLTFARLFSAGEFQIVNIGKPQHIWVTAPWMSCQLSVRAECGVFLHWGV